MSLERGDAWYAVAHVCGVDRDGATSAWLGRLAESTIATQVLDGSRATDETSRLIEGDENWRITNGANILRVEKIKERLHLHAGDGVADQTFVVEHHNKFP